MKFFYVGSIILFVPLFGLWIYGYKLAEEDLSKGLSTLEAGFTYKVLNPMSAMGYKTYLKNSKTWQEHIEKQACERKWRDWAERNYTRKDFGNDVYRLGCRRI